MGESEEFMEWRGTTDARDVLDRFRDEYFSEGGLKQRMLEEGTLVGKRHFDNLCMYLQNLDVNWMMGVKGGLQLIAALECVVDVYREGNTPNDDYFREFEKHLAQSRLPTRSDLLEQGVPVEEIPSF